MAENHKNPMEQRFLATNALVQDLNYQRGQWLRGRVAYFRSASMNGHRQFGRPGPKSADFVAKVPKCVATPPACVWKSGDGLAMSVAEYASYDAVGLAELVRKREVSRACRGRHRADRKAQNAPTISAMPNPKSIML
jgi:hypothetical protein